MRSIYRSEDGRRVIRDWCTSRLASWECPHEVREVEVLGAATHVTMAGAGGPTVVFVPGTNFNTATSLPLLGELARDCEVVGLDVPGQPGLSRGERAGDLDWYGEWLDAAIDEVRPGRDFSVRPVVLVGHSFGGAIVLASSRTDLRRVVVSTGGLCRLRVTLPMLAAFGLWAVRPTSSSSRRLLTQMLARGRGPRHELVEWMTLVGRHVRTSTTPDRVTRPPGKGTVVAVGGSEDTFLPPDRLGPAVRRSLGVDLHTIDHAGHLVIEETPDQVGRLVRTAVG